MTESKVANRFVIDRVENPWAVIEGPDGTIFRLPISMIPEGTKEGSVLHIDISVDSKQTARELDKVKRLMEELFEDEKDD